VNSTVHQVGPSKFYVRDSTMRNCCGHRSFPGVPPHVQKILEPQF
jgi:hypothetical protein